MGQAPHGTTYNNTNEGWPLIAGAGDFVGDRPVAKKYTTAPTKLCATGDIILSIRASIGDRVLADQEFCLGRGVAGLRARPDRLDRRYLWHWLSVSKRELSERGRGATFLQVSRADIAGLRVPLPPLPEQRRIAAILDRVELLRADRRRGMANIASLRPAAFGSRFGAALDAAEFVELGTLVDPARPITYGILMPGPHIPSGVPYVRVTDMDGQGIRLDGLRSTSKAIADDYRRSTLHEGDLLMSIRGHVGRTAIVPPELQGANITQDTARIPLEGCEPEFVRAWINGVWVQEWMRRHTKGVAVKGINLGDVRRLPVPDLPREQQLEFAAFAHAVSGLAASTEAHVAKLDELFASLQHRAFRGEL